MRRRRPRRAAGQSARLSQLISHEQVNKRNCRAPPKPRKWRRLPSRRGGGGGGIPSSGRAARRRQRQAYLSRARDLGAAADAAQKRRLTRWKGRRKGSCAKEIVSLASRRARPARRGEPLLAGARRHGSLISRQSVRVCRAALPNSIWPGGGGGAFGETQLALVCIATRPVWRDECRRRRRRRERRATQSE